MAIPLRQQASDGPDRDRRVALRWNATWDSGTVTAAEARAAVGDFLARVRASTRVPVPDHVAQDAHLVVSELVANVVRHAPGPCGLGLELPAAGDRLRISVWDTSPAPPRPRPPDGRRVGGHGLEIVQANQFVLFQVIEDFHAAIQQLRQRQVHRRLAQLLEPQASGLQQVRTPYPVLAPQIDQTLGPAGVGFAKPLDIAECSGIGAWVVVDEGGVVTQTHT
jgi:anti-sigma regulatory factor (Ser/Thr protein kinase)